MPLPNPFTSLRGCMFRIMGDKVIQVWDVAKCVRCQRQGSIRPTAKYCPDMQLPLDAGLRFTESEPLPELYSLFVGSGEHCAECAKNWRAGKASIREAAMGAGRG